MGTPAEHERSITVAAMAFDNDNPKNVEYW
jgi:hypothetical protein